MFTIALLVLTISPQAPASDFPLLRFGAFDVRNASLIDTVAIVRPLSRTKSERPTRTPDTTRRAKSSAALESVPGKDVQSEYALDKIEVLDSTDLPSGERVVMVTPAPIDELSPDRSYLVFMLKPVGGKLLVPLTFGRYD